MENQRRRKLLTVTTYLLSVFSGFLLALGMLFMMNAMRETQGVAFEIGFAVLALIVSIALFTTTVVLAVKRKISTTSAIIYLPLALITFILTMWMVIWTPWLRTFDVRSSDNALDPTGEQVTTRVHVFPFDKAFWMNGHDAKEYLAPINIAREKRSRLIKFTQPRSHGEVVGLDEQTTLAAFGQPVRTTKQDDHDVWTYYPWTDHPDWTLDIYLKDGRLVAIGESNLPK